MWRIEPPDQVGTPAALVETTIEDLPEGRDLDLEIGRDPAGHEVGAETAGRQGDLVVDQDRVPGTETVGKGNLTEKNERKERRKDSHQSEKPILAVSLVIADTKSNVNRPLSFDFFGRHSPY